MQHQRIRGRKKQEQTFQRSSGRRQWSGYILRARHALLRFKVLHWSELRSLASLQIGVRVHRHVPHMLRKRDGDLLAANRRAPFFGCIWLTNMKKSKKKLCVRPLDKNRTMDGNYSTYIQCIKQRQSAQSQEHMFC